MDRRLKLLIAAAVAAAAPAPVVAQAWPATIVAASPKTAPAAQPLVVVTRDARLLRRPVGVPPTTPSHRLRMRGLPTEPGAMPSIALRPKAEWTDDQGFRLGPTSLAFKRRF